MEFVRALLDIKPYLDPHGEHAYTLLDCIEALKDDKDKDVAEHSDEIDLQLM